MNLNEFKTHHRLSLTGLATLLEVPVSTVGAWLTGVRQPPAEQLAAIANRTGGAVQPADLRPDLAEYLRPVRRRANFFETNRSDPRDDGPEA